MDGKVDDGLFRDLRPDASVEGRVVVTESYVGLLRPGGATGRSKRKHMDRSDPLSY